MKHMNFIVDVDMIHRQVMFSFGEPDKLLSKRLWKFGYEDVSDIALDKCFGICKMFPDGEVIVRMPAIPTRAKEFGTLAHEINHAVFFILDRLETPLRNSTSEMYGHLTGYLTTQVYKKLGYK